MIGTLITLLIGSVIAGMGLNVALILGMMTMEKHTWEEWKELE